MEVGQEDRGRRRVSPEHRIGACVIDGPSFAQPASIRHHDDPVRTK